MLRIVVTLLVVLTLASCSSEVPQVQGVISHDIDFSNMLMEQKVDTALAAIISNVPQKKKQAEEIRLKCNGLNNYITSLKDRLITASGGKDTDGNIIHMDDQESADNILSRNKAGDTLWRNINKLRTFLLHVTTSDSTMSIPLNTSLAGRKVTTGAEWTSAEFEHVPVVAAVTLLSKEQNDLRASEFIVLKRILSEAGIKEKTSAP